MVSEYINKKELFAENRRDRMEILILQILSLEISM